ncbi:MAG: hypothetical protein U9N79_05715 [Actinomycetota bacterium]|nr:hypothetical protein [Actinomycetota bacterium]
MRKTMNRNLLVLVAAMALAASALTACSNGEGSGETTTTTETPTTTMAVTTTVAATSTTAAGSDSGSAGDSTPPSPEELKGGLFVNLSTDDMDTAAMAIGFATKVMANTGKPATIFLNVYGARLADINIPQNVHVSGSTLQEMLGMFMDAGGTVLLCPVCMKNVAGLNESEMLPGLIIGKPEYVYAAMFAEDVTVLSYGGR